MKKSIFVLLFLFVTLTFVVGCGKKGLVGSWASEEYSGSYVYTFNEDGTGNYSVAGKIMEFTYKTEGDKISILYTGNTEPFESTYKLDGDKLNILDSFGKDTIYKRK